MDLSDLHTGIYEMYSDPCDNADHQHYYQAISLCMVISNMESQSYCSLWYLHALLWYLSQLGIYTVYVAYTLKYDVLK